MLGGFLIELICKTGKYDGNERFSCMRLNVTLVRAASIKNINFDASYKNIYIQSATLDGKKYTRKYLSHDFLCRGTYNDV
ncbi:hypothetical protein GGR55DRAFT_665995 [Xylaria sp. FL0064]|nr:hypothetical protein GGR55DRAFT_665995 [Xylaria sp. FL0064]